MSRVCSHCNPIRRLEMASHTLLLLISLQVAHGNEQVKIDGYMNRLSSGMKFAQDFLGSESVALKVAEFVVRAFQTANNPQPTRRRPFTDVYDSSNEENFTNERLEYEELDRAPSPMSPIKHLVRLFGLQPKQISAVAINALVFVAQMISTFLTGPRRPDKPYRTDDPITWILNKDSRRLQEIISAAKNESLSEVIEDLIKEQGSEEQTSCIRLLVCKITPFVNRMQKVVFGPNNDIYDDDDDDDKRGSAVMYRHLPSAKEIGSRNDVCEQRHKDCDLNE